LDDRRRGWRFPERPIALQIALAGFALVLLPLQAGAFTLDAVDFGVYPHDGTHSPDPPVALYRTGNCEPCAEEWRSFFVFDLSVPGTTPAIVTAASLRLDTLLYDSPDDSETIEFFDVSTPIATLTSGAGNATDNIAIFDDLGGGTSYGSRAYSEADENLVREIELDAAAVAAINAALGGSFAIGASLIDCATCLDPGQGLADELVFADGFGDAGSAIKQLVLVPEPSTALLLAWGLAGLAGRTRRG
jgi:hypothetical protein